MSKFKVGDKVRVIKSISDAFDAKRTIGEIGIIIDTDFNEVYPYNVKFEKLELAKMLPIFAEEELELMKPAELFEEKTEFTFQEVIARNIPGVYTECTNNEFRVNEVHIGSCGLIKIKGDLKGVPQLKGAFGISGEARFKAIEPKKRCEILLIEHQKDGKKYKFRSDEKYPGIKEFMVCDTSQGKSYGRVVDWEYEQLTEKEYLEYKKCWRAK